MPSVEVIVPTHPTVVPIPVAPVPNVQAPSVVEVTTPVVHVVPAEAPRAMLERVAAGLAEFQTVFDFVGSVVYLGESVGSGNPTSSAVWRIGVFDDSLESPSVSYCGSGAFAAVWDLRDSYTYDTPV